MKLLKLFAVASVALVVSTSSFARMENLQISNFSNSRLSVRVNGICSGELGTIYAGSIKSYPDATFKRVCGANISPCHMDIYADEFCRGELIETSDFYSLTNFVKTVTYSTRFRTGVTNTINGYDLFFSEY